LFPIAISNLSKAMITYWKNDKTSACIEDSLVAPIELVFLGADLHPGRGAHPVHQCVGRHLEPDETLVNWVSKHGEVRATKMNERLVCC
jgi:hypothetical protein